MVVHITHHDEMSEPLCLVKSQWQTKLKWTCISAVDSITQSFHPQDQHIITSMRPNYTKNLWFKTVTNIATLTLIRPPKISIVLTAWYLSSSKFTKLTSSCNLCFPKTKLRSNTPRWSDGLARISILALFSVCSIRVEDELMQSMTPRSSNVLTVMETTAGLSWMCLLVSWFTARCLTFSFFFCSASAHFQWILHLAQCPYQIKSFFLILVLFNITVFVSILINNGSIFFDVDWNLKWITTWYGKPLPPSFLQVLLH